MKQNWQIKKLGEVCEFTRGLTYSKNDEVVFSDNIVLRSNNIDLDSNSLDLSELKYIKSDIIIPNDKRIEKDSLIICTANGSKAHLGKVALINIENNFAFGGFMGKIKPSESINAKYLYYSMISPDYKKFISKLSDGANINNLKFKDLSLFPIPIPPLADQRRIVANLDAKFAQINALKAAAQKNLDNAEQLWKAKLEKEFGNKEWKMMKLGEVCDSCLGKMLDKHKNKGTLQVYLANINVRWGSFDLKNLPMMKFEDNENERYGIRKGDLIICEGGEPGRCAIWNDEMPNMKIQKALHRVRCHKTLNNYYLYYWLVYTCSTKKIEEHLSGTTIKHLPGEKLKALQIPIPPLTEQTAIVSRLDALSAQISELKAKYRRQIECCDELRQSLLREAFEGEM